MSTGQRSAVRLSCYVRSLALLRTVESTVRSFAKTCNSALKDRLDREVEALLSTNTSLYIDRVESQMVRDLTSSSKPTDGVADEEFQDLESLAKRKLKLMDQLEEVSTESKLVSMAVFENKWFGFLLQKCD